MHVVFSLPFNLRGILAITDVSDHMTQLVRAQTQQQGPDAGDSKVIGKRNLVYLFNFFFFYCFFLLFRFLLDKARGILGCVCCCFIYDLFTTVFGGM